MSLTTFTSSVLPPHERGVELGRRFADEIADTVARYRTLFEARALGPFDVDLWSARAWRTIQRVAPAHADEIAGIAEGAGVPVESVASINARTEILVAANPTGQTECSTVVSLPPGRPPVAVQTWDWYDAMSDGWFTWTIPHPDGRVVQTVTEYGMLAKIGVNDRGVGVMLNMLHHADDAGAVEGGEIGHPVHLLSRAILDDAASVDDAIAIASAPPHLGVHVPDRASTTGAVRSRSSCSPVARGCSRRRTACSCAPTTSSPASGRDGCLASTIGISTVLRRDHLVAAFAQRMPQTTQDVYDAMTHHFADGGVCRHPLTDTDPVLWHRTLATVGIDVAARTLDVHEDGPCGHRMAPVEQTV